MAQKMRRDVTFDAKFCREETEVNFNLLIFLDFIQKSIKIIVH